MPSLLVNPIRILRRSWLIINMLGIKVFLEIINAAVLITPYSITRTEMYASSRYLRSIASRGNASRFFSRMNRLRVLYVSMCVHVAFSFLTYLNSPELTSQVSN